MTIYALGRDLGFGDQAAIDEAVEAMKTKPTLRTLIRHTVTSELFRME